MSGLLGKCYSVSYKLSIYLPYATGILPLGIYPRGKKCQWKEVQKMFIADVFVMAQTGNSPDIHQ